MVLDTVGHSDTRNCAGILHNFIRCSFLRGQTSYCDSISFNLDCDCSIFVQYSFEEAVFFIRKMVQVFVLVIWSSVGFAGSFVYHFQ